MGELWRGAMMRWRLSDCYGVNDFMGICRYEDVLIASRYLIEYRVLYTADNGGRSSSYQCTEGVEVGCGRKLGGDWVVLLGLRLEAARKGPPPFS